MSEVKSVPTDYGRSHVIARTRWRASRRGRRDGRAGIGTGYYAREIEEGLRMTLNALRSRFLTEHAALIDRVCEESRRIATEYDEPREDGRRADVPAALARFGGWVSQWRTEVTACQQRGLALAACADQELAHYEAAYARTDRQDVPLPAASASAAALDGTWTGAPDWELDGPLVRRALEILEQRIGPATGAAGQRGRGDR
ncbi:hypothetical protein OG742_17905 [Streptomyces sp. NBC_00828]|uniref:hypothetical protein n=1 Tax=Streptomyces sp. NBC_00828 TaxID=2903678 RepID=UPI0038650E3E